MLKSIRDITGQLIDRNQLEEWYKERDFLKKKKNSKNNIARIKELQDNIYNMMYIPQYITVVMENVKDYERIYKKGFYFNGRLFKRISCSASQARVSTVVFCDDEIREELRKRLDNGRDLNHPLAPSKYNAYFGLYSSATKRVTKPRFCIIPDYSEVRPVDVDFVIEQPADQDDIIEPRTIDVEFNMVDGSGLISPAMAEQWGKDLEEDYTPCQFCIRCAFTKGAVNEFDFVEWCKEENNGNYIVKDVYGKEIDLREIDVILTEGMAKLWDSWESQEFFEQCCEENGIIWGVTKYAPKKDKEVNTANYQFLQTLNLTDEMIESVCKDTVEYIQGVSYDNIYYTLLFLLGENLDKDNIEKYMESSDNYWLKTLVLNHNLFHDKYSKEKIRDFIVRKIELACLGKILIRGNFQCIVVDGYAFMQAATGQPVTGLLKAGEMYSQFWNERGINRIDTMRSPLTHFSEHYVVDLKNDEKMQKWFKYSYSGIIVNCHDAHTMHYAGSDYDYDILFSTDNQDFINGIYKNQRVVTYQAKKPKKKLFTEDDLFVTDTFSFGTQIGQITNTCSTICALMSNFKEGSAEYQLLQDRLKAGCAAQSRQIDKTKIGEQVKTLATVCKQFQHINYETDSLEDIKRKKFLNSILADRKPYFFRYKYNALNKEYNEFVKKNDEDCQIRFCMSLKELFAIPDEERTEAQQEFIRCYNHFLPVIDSDCVMNKICKHIEGIDFHIKQKIRSSQSFDYRVLLSENFSVNKKLYEQIYELITVTFKEWDSRKKDKVSSGAVKERNSTSQITKEKFDKEGEYALLKVALEELCSNEEMLANHLVYLFYVDKPSYNKNVLWSLVGKQIFENVKDKTSSYYFPQKNPSGSLRFLFENYSIERVLVEKKEEPIFIEGDKVND